MIALIGAGLILYGYVSFRYPFFADKKRRTEKSRSTTNERLMTIQKVGGLLFMIVGGLLILTFFII